MIPRALYGLRARLIGALLLTSAVTIAVVAVALLSPLENLLRTDRLDSLTAAVVAQERSYAGLSQRELRRRGALLVRSLGRKTGAEVTLLEGTKALATTDPHEPVDYRPVARSLSNKRSVRAVVEGSEGPEARVAVPLPGRRGLGLLLVAPLEEARTATTVVERALLKATLVGLAVALLVGLALATRLARRLRRLRDTALRVSELGPTLEMQADSTRDEVGDLTRALATMQSQLQQQERARRTFVSTASHELRTPLTSLQLMLGMLREDLSANEPDVAAAAREVARAEAQTERLSRLSADLLDLSRIDAGVPLRRDTVELGELSRAVAGSSGPSSRKSGVTSTSSRRTPAGRSRIPWLSRGSCASCWTTRSSSHPTANRWRSRWPAARVELPYRSPTAALVCLQQNGKRSSSASAAAAPRPTEASVLAWRSPATWRDAWTATSASMPRREGTRFTLLLPLAPPPAG